MDLQPVRENNNINENNNYCNRCKVKTADFKCEPCSPFIFFCASCDGYVHSMNTKRHHDRQLISRENEKIEKDIYSSLESNDGVNFKSVSSMSSGLDYSQSYRQINSGYNPTSNNNPRDNFMSHRESHNKNAGNNSAYMNPINNTNNLNHTTNTNNIGNINQTQRENYKHNLNNSPNNLTNTHNTNNNNGYSGYNNYHNTVNNDSTRNHEMKNIYIKEREDLCNKIFSLEKQTEFLKSSSDEKITKLQSLLEETNKRYILEKQMVQDEHELQIKKMANEKDNQIRILEGSNDELHKRNHDLVNEVNSYQHELYHMKNNFSNKLTGAEFDLKQKIKENDDMKDHYEKKINSLNDNFLEDKSKLIANYEKNIEKINNGYKESKEKYLSLLSKRDNDYHELLTKMKKEEV